MSVMSLFQAARNKWKWKLLCLSTSLQTTIKHDTDTGINIQYAKLILLLKEVKVTKQLWTLKSRRN